MAPAPTIPLSTLTSPSIYSSINQSISSPGTFTLIKGIQGQSIKLLNYVISTSSGTLYLQDSAGLIINQPASSQGSNALVILTSGADLQVVVSDISTISCYFVTLFNSFPRVQVLANRSLNTPFQVSTSQDSIISYSVQIVSALSLLTGAVGTVFLEISPVSDFSSGVQAIANFTNGHTGNLSIGLSITHTGAGILTGFVPAAYYCRLRTLNVTGTPVFSYQNGQELLL